MTKSQSTFEQEGKLPSFKSDTEKDSINKRSRAPPEYDDEEDDEEPEVSADELAKMSRSERKRHREKKRRNDVNKGLDELMNLLFEIDPNLRKETEEYRSRRGKTKGGAAGAHDENILSRVDLIAHAVEILRRVHRENEERKKIIATLTLSAQSRSAVTTATTANIANMQPGSLTNSLLQHLNRDNQYQLQFMNNVGAFQSAGITTNLFEGNSIVDYLSTRNSASQLFPLQNHLLRMNQDLSMRMNAYHLYGLSQSGTSRSLLSDVILSSSPPLGANQMTESSSYLGLGQQNASQCRQKIQPSPEYEK